MWASAKSCCQSIDVLGPHSPLTRALRGTGGGPGLDVGQARAFAADLHDVAMNRLTAGPATLSPYRSARDFPGGTITLIPLRRVVRPGARHRCFVKRRGVRRDGQACMLHP